MSFSIMRCVMCGRTAHRRCLHCNEPICTKCAVRHHGKVYCSPRHKDNDQGIGRLLRVPGRILKAR